MEKNLNMPQTSFSQRSNSQQTEPMFLKMWESVLEERNKMNNGEYNLHDGPPYANGDVHLGHVLNKVLKDFFVKFNLMDGRKVSFRPGFDCHGLPTELAVQKKFGKLDKVELRNKCQDWAEEFSEKQKSTFKTLGVFAEWDNPYKTMYKEFEVSQLSLLYKLLKNNYLYLDKRPVYYSPSTQTVLAEAELEYKERVDTSVYLKLETNKGFSLVVWTTQPWTMLSNAAVAYNKNLNYVKALLNGVYYVLLESKLSLLENVESFEKFTDFDDVTYYNPLTSETKTVLHGSFVKDGTGSGLVHLSPAHGEDDFDLCSKNGLFSEDVTDNYGKLSNGMFCLDEGSKYVLGLMSDLDMVVKVEDVTHSYPHDWRTGKPVYFKLTEQVFLDLDDLKEQSLESLEHVNVMDNSKKKFTNMLNGRGRWCLSRQRTWGFPLAVFFKDGVPFYEESLENHLTQLFSEKGSNCWFEMDDKDLLPNEFKNLGLVKCNYTMDVWFDSGSSWHNVLGDKQADLYLEGSDQHRGWFQSSLLLSTAVNGRAPYKSLLSHGFVLDSSGRKMSKSLGNVVDPKTLQSKYNTDVLRLWVASSNYLDVKMSDDVMKVCSTHYFKFRNTLKYLLGNFYGYVPCDFELREKDKLALSLVKDLKKSGDYYKNGDFRKVLDLLSTSVLTFSSQYLDNDTKSDLYEYTLDSMERRRCQYVMKEFFETFVKYLSPLCPFLSEDAYQNYEFKEFNSVFMEKY